MITPSSRGDCESKLHLTPPPERSSNCIIRLVQTIACSIWHLLRAVISLGYLSYRDSNRLALRERHVTHLKQPLTSQPPTLPTLEPLSIQKNKEQEITIRQLKAGGATLQAQGEKDRAAMNKLLEENANQIKQRDETLSKRSHQLGALSTELTTVNEELRSAQEALASKKSLLKACYKELDKRCYITEAQTRTVHFQTEQYAKLNKALLTEPRAKYAQSKALCENYSKRIEQLTLHTRILETTLQRRKKQWSELLRLNLNMKFKIMQLEGRVQNLSSSSHVNHPLTQQTSTNKENRPPRLSRARSVSASHAKSNPTPKPPLQPPRSSSLEELPPLLSLEDSPKPHLSRRNSLPPLRTPFTRIPKKVGSTVGAFTLSSPNFSSSPAMHYPPSSPRLPKAGSNPFDCNMMISQSDEKEEAQ